MTSFLLPEKQLQPPAETRLMPVKVPRPVVEAAVRPVVKAAAVPVVGRHRAVARPLAVDLEPVAVQPPAMAHPAMRASVQPAVCRIAMQRQRGRTADAEALLQAATTQHPQAVAVKRPEEEHSLPVATTQLLPVAA